MSELNGMDAAELREYVEMVRKDSSEAERNPTVVATWLGGSRSRVVKGDVAATMGGDGEMTPMWMLLSALAACDVDVVATHATLQGLRIESLRVEATGHFNVASYLGVGESPTPGYDSVAYTIHVHAPGATPQQIATLRKMVERFSPVGDSLRRTIGLKAELVVDTSPP